MKKLKLHEQHKNLLNENTIMIVNRKTKIILISICNFV